MARELSSEDLDEMAAVQPEKYYTNRLMHPLWQSFVLDVSEIQQLELLDAGRRTSHGFMSRLTGIEVKRIDSLFYLPGDSVVSVVPTASNEEFTAFLRSRPQASES